MRVLCLVCGVVLLASCGGDKKCDGPGVARAFAGEGVVDCGDVKVAEDRGPALSCARDTHSRGEPFFLRIRSLGTDSAIADTFASSGTQGLHVHEDWFPCDDHDSPRCIPTVWRRTCAITFGESFISCEGDEPAERVCE